MRIDEADERDSSWEDARPVYRVYLFSGGGGEYSWAVTTFDVQNAEVDEVISWAESRVGPGDLYSVALRHGEGEDRGLIWLLGSDINAEPINEQEHRSQARMLERRDATT